MIKASVAGCSSQAQEEDEGEDELSAKSCHRNYVAYLVCSCIANTLLICIIVRHKLPESRPLVEDQEGHSFQSELDNK